MSTIVEIKVPDIGEYKDVSVIEVLVKAGDSISIDDPLITLETDKATMEVPSTHMGTIKSIDLQVGDTVSAGSPILVLEVNDLSESSASASPVNVSLPEKLIEPLPNEASDAPQNIGHVAQKCELVVLGGGPAGYAAAFRAADLGMNTILIEQYSTLGGVCLNVGCIPSKTLLHTASILDEVRRLAKQGISFAPPTIDLAMLRLHKDKVINRLTTGLNQMAKMRKVAILQGIGVFIDASHIEVALTHGTHREKTGEKKIVRFEKAIIAAGSSILTLPIIPSDPRIMDSTAALAINTIPEKMLIIGGGIIGLEMATVYSALGARIDIVEMASDLMQGADRNLVDVWYESNKNRFDQIMLNTKTTVIEPKPDGVWVHFEGKSAPAQPQRYDLVLHATGRIPNGKLIGADKAGINVAPQGVIPVDSQQRTNVPHIYAVGDIVGQPMLAHKGTHQGHIAAENAAGHTAYFDAKVIPNVAYTDPEIAWVGITETQALKENIKFTKSLFPWSASGRAIANSRDEGLTQLFFDPNTHQIIGGAIVGLHAGEMIGEICLAIEMGADNVDISKTIHPHPTTIESIGMAAEVALGVCTDLPAQKMK